MCRRKKQNEQSQLLQMEVRRRGTECGVKQGATLTGERHQAQHEVSDNPLAGSWGYVVSEGKKNASEKDAWRGERSRSGRTALGTGLGENRVVAHRECVIGNERRPVTSGGGVLSECRRVGVERSEQDTPTEGGASSEGADHRSG